jgi:hypothetical protein
MALDGIHGIGCTMIGLGVHHGHGVGILFGLGHGAGARLGRGAGAHHGHGVGDPLGVPDGVGHLPALAGEAVLPTIRQHMHLTDVECLAAVEVA